MDIAYILIGFVGLQLLMWAIIGVVLVCQWLSVGAVLRLTGGKVS